MQIVGGEDINSKILGTTDIRNYLIHTVFVITHSLSLNLKNIGYDIYQNGMRFGISINHFLIKNRYIKNGIQLTNVNSRL